MSEHPQEIALYQKVKNEAARKRLDIKAAFFWCTSKKESLAASRMALALDEAGYNDEDFAKPIRVNLPVVSDLPLEGVIDTKFCDRYQLGDDGMTFALIPGAVPHDEFHEEVSESTVATVTDDDTASVAQVDGDSSNGTEEKELPELKTIASLPFNQRLIAHFLHDEYQYHIHADRGDLKKIIVLEMDTDEKYIQNLLLSGNNTPELKTYPDFNLFTYTQAVKQVFPIDKPAPLLGDMVTFAKKYIATEHIDRKLMIQAWLNGNREFVVKRTPSGATAGGSNHTDRLTPQTALGQEYEIVLGLIARDREFDIYNVPLEVDALANSMMNKLDNKEYLATREIFIAMPGGFDYSRACNIATVKTTPAGLWETPSRHLDYLNKVMTETDHAHPSQLVVDIACGRSSMTMPMPVPKQMSDEEALEAFGADETSSNEGEKAEVATAEITDNVQIQETNVDEVEAGDALQRCEDAVQSGESVVVDSEESAPLVSNAADILAANAPHLANQNEPEASQNSDITHENVPEPQQVEPKVEQIAPIAELPPYFEPGRYEGIPNESYHSSNGVSSTMLKDARVSLMYFKGRHITRTIPREQSDALLRGNIIHTYVLEPEKFNDEFSFPADIPAGVLTTSSDFVSVIKEYNATLPTLKTPDELKQWIEAYNNTQIQPLSLGNSVEETYKAYESIPEKYQRGENGPKLTGQVMKACIKEYNASLPPLLKTSGSREQLLDQISSVEPEFAEAERAKFLPYNISGTKEQLSEIVKAIRPDAVTSEDFHKQQEELCQGKTMISLDMYKQAKNISAALQAHSGASRLLNHPSRQSEVSYFGIDDDTGIETRVRPDLEVTIGNVRIGGDLKTLGIQNVKQERLRDRIHREIIERDYHLSAAMYCDVASLDQFFWIFVNKEPGYHWVAVIEASRELLELGRLEYKRTLNRINEAHETGNWPAPIADDYIDELNDFDVRRLEMLLAEKGGNHGY
jgi:exodeoxyribonuclease VIII